MRRIKGRLEETLQCEGVEKRTELNAVQRAVHTGHTDAGKEAHTRV